ncbi:GIY-YIG nuclease family protein [Vibrio mexicanus]|uniref:GIY-YIG nuclease family protein n=1 Tax=Vibrio mexicanus TaxID=1004326 RepID=UPI00063C8331|nr:GIY-YIG nuclease family protein [Vibrio mexicanus]
MNNDWYIYLVRTRLNTLYCGITTDVERRFKEHVSGEGAKALKGKGPLTLAWSTKTGDSRSIASKYEYAVKRLSKQKKERLILGQLTLSELSISN